jgi:hypothetical protein
VSRFPPRRALHATVCTVRRFNLTRRAMPMFLVSALGLTLSLPKLHTHAAQYGPAFPKPLLESSITRNGTDVRRPWQSSRVLHDCLRLPPVPVI